MKNPLGQLYPFLLLNQHGKETKPSDMMQLLPALSPKVQRLNVIWVFGGSLLLVLASLLRG